MESRTIRVAVAYHSGFGHTERVAEAVRRGAESIPGTQAEALSVAELEPELWERLAEADAIIFGAPTYVGGPSAAFKAFADASSKVWAERGWTDKVAAGFTNSAQMSGDKLHTLISFAILAAQHGMHWVNMGILGGWSTSKGSPEELNRLGSWLGAMAQSNADEGPDMVPPTSDLRTAEHLGERVARLTRQLVLGRAAEAGLSPAEPRSTAA